MLRPCNEINRDSFDCLSYAIYKDNNHGYYLKKELNTNGENNNTVDDIDYGIIEKADQRIFVKINNKHLKKKHHLAHYNGWKENKLSQ